MLLQTEQPDWMRDCILIYTYSGSNIVACITLPLPLSRIEPYIGHIGPAIAKSLLPNPSCDVTASSIVWAGLSSKGTSQDIRHARLQQYRKGSPQEAPCRTAHVHVRCDST